MKLKEAMSRVRGYLGALDYALEYDPVETLAARLDLLERRVADLDARTQV